MLEIQACSAYKILFNESNLTYSQILDATLDGSRWPLGLTRISVKLNGIQLPNYALNDILVSHPCPASVSRFSFRYGF
jgi:NAD+ kinase